MTLFVFYQLRELKYSTHSVDNKKRFYVTPVVFYAQTFCCISNPQLKIEINGELKPLIPLVLTSLYFVPFNMDGINSCLEIKIMKRE